MNLICVTLYLIPSPANVQHQKQKKQNWDIYFNRIHIYLCAFFFDFKYHIGLHIPLLQMHTHCCKTDYNADKPHKHAIFSLQFHLTFTTSKHILNRISIISILYDMSKYLVCWSFFGKSNESIFEFDANVTLHL